MSNAHGFPTSSTSTACGYPEAQSMEIGSGKPDYSRLSLPGPRDDRPYVLINMVMSADGKIVIDGNEQGIGSPTDQRLMRELRVNADVVINGAETLRKSGASPRLGDANLEAIRLAAGKPKLPTSAVLTSGGNLPLERAFFTATDEFDAVVFAGAGITAKQRAAIEGAGRPVVVLPESDAIASMLRCMRTEMGASVVLVEGGADLNRAFFEADAVDEYFVTIGPVIVGGRSGLSAVGGDRAWPRDAVRRMELLSAYSNAETSEIYLRWRVKPTNHRE